MNKIFLLLLPLLFLSCSGGGKKSLPASIGQPSEVLLVLDNGAMASDLKDSLKEALTCAVPGLTRDEPFFRLSRVPLTIYKGEMLKMHSKLLVRVDAAAEGCQIQVAHDVDAAPQIQVLLSGPSVEQLLEYQYRHAGQIRQLLLDHQLQMQQKYLRRHHSRQVKKELQRMGLDGLLPEEIAWTKVGKDFLWGSSRTSEKQLNFVCYTLPSSVATVSLPPPCFQRPVLGDTIAESSTAPIQPSSTAAQPSAPPLPDLRRQMEIRDSVMQRNIPGSRPDQWMETVWEQGQPVVTQETQTLSGHPVSIARGLWQMHNGAMGGPFVSYCWHDEPHHRLVFCEGFVYSPPTDKRDLVRKLEAGIRTVNPFGR